MLRMTAYPTYTPALTLPTPLTPATDALARFPYIPHWRLRAPVLRSIAPRALSLALALATCLFTPHIATGIPSRSALTAQAHPAAAPVASVASVTLDAFTRSLAHQAVTVTHAAVSAVASVHRSRRKQVVRRTVMTAQSAPSGGISQWAYTGHAAYWVGVRSGAYPGGQCTWWAWSRDTRLTGLGNADAWAVNARARGFLVAFTPRVGATVVFAPGVQGASSLGHVGHVEAVYANGWFLISEMNFGWNGGGFARVDYRYAHTGAGVQFIY